MARILLIEDEPDIARTVQYRLTKEGFTVEVAGTAEEGLQCAAARRPDLVILDLMLPDLPGTEVCRRLRQNPATAGLPIIMATARAEEIDRVVGFELGADDYVVKPYSARELALRVRAVLRRARPVLAAGPRLRVDEGGHRAWADGVEVELTALEFKLLAYFLANPGRVLERDELLTEVWGYREGVASRTVDTHVKRLRAKLGEAGEAIDTLRGVGYRYLPEA